MAWRPRPPFAMGVPIPPGPSAAAIFDAVPRLFPVVLSKSPSRFVREWDPSCQLNSRSVACVEVAAVYYPPLRHIDTLRRFLIFCSVPIFQHGEFVSAIPLGCR